jgi:cellulose synthase/poly-beta-1,6-N-acetylglucosamine synthase-like glycosyltransferase
MNPIMIDVVITSFKEPKTIGKAIEAFLDQDIDQRYQITISAPDDETLNVARQYSKKDKRVKLFRDPGKGKMFALHLLFKKLKGEILVFSDGDVFVKKDSLKHLINPFNNPKVGVVTGRPVSLDSKKKMLGYWSHLLCDAGAHEARLRRFKKGQYFECSGYLWAFRNGIVDGFPMDLPEDASVPLMFSQKGYRIIYTPNAEVYVSYPKNFRDFIDQKKRTTKAHVQMSKHFDFSKLPKTKSFKNEALESYRAFSYPENPMEMIWTLLLFPAKLYVWLLVYYHVKVAKKLHEDGWKATKSTKNIS